MDFKKERKERKIRRKEFVKALGVSKDEIKAWDNGSLLPDQKALKALELDLVQPAGFFKDWGKSLRLIQIEYGLSRKELADRIGVDLDEILFFEQKDPEGFPHARVLTFLVNERKRVTN